jgi:hypothetical protein
VYRSAGTLTWDSFIVLYDTSLQVGLAISDKKFFSAEDRILRNNWFVPAEFRLFRGTENSRNYVPNRFAEEKNARNSVQWNKNKSDSRNSVPDHSAEEKNAQNSVPWNKKEADSRNSVLNHSEEEKTTRIPFRGTNI